MTRASTDDVGTTYYDYDATGAMTCRLLGGNRLFRGHDTK